MKINLCVIFFIIFASLALYLSKFSMSAKVSQWQRGYYIIDEVVLHLATVNLKLK